MIVIGLDQSLNRPGFAAISPSEDGLSAHLLSVSHTDNRHLQKEPDHVRIARSVSAILQFSARYASSDLYFVREDSFFRHARVSEKLWKVNGAVEYALWTALRTPVALIGQAEAKRQVVGDGKASKEDAAAALSLYLGHHDYVCDDESDAACVAVAFCLKNGQLLPKTTGVQSKREEKKG